MLINLNDRVKVRLTETGKQHLKTWHYRLYYFRKEKPKFKLPEEDKDGYSTWHLWQLMGIFGEFMYKHRLDNLPFEPDIYYLEY